MTRMTSFAKRTLLVALIAPVAGLGACISGYTASTAPSDPSACSTEVVPALALNVRDSVTQRAIASGVLVSGLVSGKKGTYTISQPLTSDSLTIWLGTISGTYNVAFRRSGYADMTKTGIVVPSADSLDCHPKTVTVDVLMRPTS